MLPKSLRLLGMARRRRMQKIQRRTLVALPRCLPAIDRDFNRYSGASLRLTGKSVLFK